MLCSCSAMAKGKRSGKKPMQQNIEFFARLKKPMEAIGKQIRVPGSYWAGNMTAAEKDTDYFWCASLPCARLPHISTLSERARTPCGSTVRDFSIAHTFPCCVAANVC